MCALNTGYIGRFRFQLDIRYIMAGIRAAFGGCYAFGSWCVLVASHWLKDCVGRGRRGLIAQWLLPVSFQGLHTVVSWWHSRSLAQAVVPVFSGLRLASPVSGLGRGRFLLACAGVGLAQGIFSRVRRVAPR